MTSAEKEKNRSKEKEEVTFEVTEHIGVLASYATGWTKELNLVAWNGKPPKYDLRDWSENHEHMSRGITLHRDEMQKLLQLMAERDLEETA